MATIGQQLPKVRSIPMLLSALFLLVAVACGTSATATPAPPTTTTAPAPTKAPVAAAAPTPTRAAVATPTAAVVATPTKAPVAAPTPTKAPAVVAKHKPTGELRVVMQTFGNERWLPGATPGAEATAYHPIFETLLTRHPETGAWVGELAESWDIRDGGRVWEFRLRKGVQFHEGWGEVTAEDLKYSFERFAAEGAANGRRPVFQKIKEYQTPDPNTIILNFKTPEILFGDDTNSAIPGTQYAYSKKYVTTVGDEKADLKPIGTGPYRLVKHVRGDRMETEAVEGQWMMTPAFAKLTLLKVVEDSTRVAMVRAGAADIIDIGVDFAKELQAAKVKIIRVPRFATVGVTLGGQWPTKATFDPKVPWAGDPKDPASMERARKVRQALNLAVDKQAVIDAALGGLATPNMAVGYYYSGEPWTLPDLKPYPYDPAQARKLMAEAGYTNCFEFTMNLTAWPGRAFLPVVGEAVATQWEANLGCKIKRRPLDRAVFATDFGQRTYPGVALAYAMPFVGREPWQLYRLISYTKAAAMLVYEDAQLDVLLEKAGATVDFNERVKIMQEMARHIYEQVPRIEIAETFGIFGVSDRVKTWPLTPGNGFLHNLHYVNLVWAPPGQPVALAK